MRTIGWGIIGCGDVTEVKSGPGFQRANASRLVAVMRRAFAGSRALPSLRCCASASTATPALATNIQSFDSRPADPITRL